jgi:hypothetical protein
MMPMFKVPTPRIIFLFKRSLHPLFPDATYTRNLYPIALASTGTMQFGGKNSADAATVIGRRKLNRRYTIGR